MEYVSQAVNLNKRNPHYRNTLGNILRLKGKFNEALEEYKQAIALEPRMPDFYNGIGITLQDMDEHKTAIDYFNKALSLNPSHAMALMNAAVSYDKILNLEKAREFIDKAKALEPENPMVLLNYANIYKNNMKYSEAIAAAKKLIEKEYANVVAHTILAESYYYYGDHENAVKAYGMTIEKSPDLPALKIQQKLLFPHVLKSSEEIDIIRNKFFQDIDEIIKSKITIERPEYSGITIPFYHAYYGRNDKDMRLKLAEMFRAICPFTNYVAPHCKDYKFEKGRKIKIGFICNYFYDHVISYLMNRLIENICDNQAYEVYALTLVPKQDDVTKKLAEKANFIILPRDMEKAREQIAKKALDIIVYPEVGLSFPIYLMAFCRLAPIQCVISGGHPLTTGIDTLDYSFSYKALEPKNAQEHYTERLIELDCMPAIVSKASKPEKYLSRKELGLPDDAHLYACPALTHRIHPDMDEAFNQIIKKDPKAKIIIFSSPVDNLWTEELFNRFKKTIKADLDKHFIIIKFITDKERFKSILAAVDVILDPFHFSLGSTLYTIFALDLPVVSWGGDFMRGRSATGLYKFMHMEDVIAKTHMEYVELAVRFANDPKFKQEICERIKKNSHYIYDNTSFVNEMTKAIDKFFA